MATFPSYADILLGGYSETQDTGVKRTETDGGIAKQRPGWSIPVVRRSASISVASLTDKQAFDTWMKNELAGGALWFDFTDPVDGKTKRAQIVGGTVTWENPGCAWVGACEIDSLYTTFYTDVEVGRLVSVAMTVPTAAAICVGRFGAWGLTEPGRADVLTGRLVAVAMTREVV